MALTVVLIAVGILLVVVAVVLLRRRSSADGVDSFRRQIDALSPEARRPTIEQMKPSEPPPADDDGDHEP